MYNELYIIANEFKPNVDYYINDNGTYKKVELNENNFSSGEYYTKIVLNVSQMSSPFIPVRCTENKLKNFDGHDGYVYFTTDTKKIFMGANGDILEMCGNRGFFYAKKDIKYEDNGIAPEENVTFFQAEIEGNLLPEADDLILNKDGCFYRVLSVSEEFGEIYTKRLTLQGSGSVGPGTDSGAPNYTLVVLSQKYTYGTSAEKFPVSIK